MSLTLREIAKLIQIEQAATPAPWSSYSTSLSPHGGIGKPGSDEAVLEDGHLDPSDAASIVAARSAVPALLKMLAERDARIQELMDPARDALACSTNSARNTAQMR